MPTKPTIQDQTFLFTGTLTEFTRDEAEALVEANGGKVISGVTAKLNYLVVGEDAGSKLAKAKALKTVKILTEKEFLKMVPKAKITAKKSAAVNTIKLTKLSATKKATTKESAKNAEAKNGSRERVFEEVKLGKQIWMAKNLDVTHFRNGDVIPEAKTDKAWKKAGHEKKPAWCFYNNDPLLGEKYGKLYNWYALVDARGLIPEGWEMPEDETYYALIQNYGDDEKAWNNMNSSNLNGFRGEPGGLRDLEGVFSMLDEQGFWWCINERNENWADYFYLDYVNKVPYCAADSKANGFSIRCFKPQGGKSLIKKQVESVKEISVQNSYSRRSLGRTENQIIEKDWSSDSVDKNSLKKLCKDLGISENAFFKIGGPFDSESDSYFYEDFFTLFNPEVMYCIYKMEFEGALRINFGEDPTSYIVEEYGRLNRNLDLTLVKDESGIQVQLELEHFYDFDDVDDAKILKRIKAIMKSDKASRKWPIFELKRNDQLAWDSFRNLFLEHFKLDEISL
jgi:uncharacterized protein (TIGR02145 family)